MSSSYTSYFVLILLTLGTICESSKILFIMPMGSKSHKNFYDGLVRALARADHQITMVSSLNRKLDEPNVKNVILKEDLMDDFVGNPFDKPFVEIISTIFNTGVTPCLTAFKDDLTQKALEEDYDVIILSFFMTECFLPTIYKKKVPFIYAMPVLALNSYSSIMGNIEFPSIVPQVGLEATYPMTFTQRMAGALGSVLMELLIFHLLNSKYETQCREAGIWSDEIPPINELLSSSAIAICNSVQSLEYPARPFSPTIIFAGGIHIEPPKPLPKDINDFIESSGEDGFILFSLGSVTKTQFMKEEHRKIMVNVFSQLKQKVLWKWDSEVMEDLPSNVMLSKWLPQTDILAHPKIKLFITHGGLLSTLESSHYGVPILGMAVFADQHTNLAKSKAEGWALKVDWNELTEELLRNAIDEAFNDPRMKEIATKRSNLMQDRPLTAAEEVVYWVEYVIRHNGADHLKCPFATMSWIQIYNMDVWFVIISTVLLILAVLIACATCCLRLILRCFRSKEKKKSKDD